MKHNYLIVLFKNKKKRKIINSYATEMNAKKKFDDIIKNNKIVFEKIIENATPVEYELGLLTNTSNVQKSLFITDDLGRNNPVNLEDPDYVFLDLKKYYVEEKVFDWQTQNKISFGELINTYCNNTELKNIFTLHNKICIQLDSDVSLFSLKDKTDSERLLNKIEEYFYEKKRLDGIFVRDVSSAQRKWLYELLEKKGYDKKRLYRLKTTFSKR
jgi:hypothetical protein